MSPPMVEADHAHQTTLEALIHQEVTAPEMATYDDGNLAGLLMGPSIILDKNAIQGLSFLEIQALHRFYLVNIPPVLVKEVIGDMAKLSVNGTPEQEVTLLARKMLPDAIVVNTEFSMVVQGECVGHEAGPDMRPFVINAVPTETSGGASGFHLPEAPEALALGRWRNNEFRDGDKVMGELWRSTTTNPQAVADVLSWWRGYQPFSARVTSLEKALSMADGLLADLDRQAFWLKFIAEEFDIPARNISVTFARWRAAGRPPIEKFAPYSFYCCRVRLFFILGLLNNLFGATTHEVDLQYLYYLPFTRVFVSNDRFHRRTVPLFLGDGQRFWIGLDLKADLRRILDHYAGTTGTAGLSPSVKQPPALSASLTYDLWASISPGSLAPMRDDKDEAYYARTARAIYDGTWQPPIPSRNGEPDYFMTSTTYGLEDLCPCKSGRFVKECPCRVGVMFRQMFQ